jgi:hypothetical protein
MTSNKKRLLYKASLTRLLHLIEASATFELLTTETIELFESPVSLVEYTIEILKKDLPELDTEKGWNRDKRRKISTME